MGAAMVNRGASGCMILREKSLSSRISDSLSTKHFLSYTASGRGRAEQTYLLGKSRERLLEQSRMPVRKTREEIWPSPVARRDMTKRCAPAASPDWSG